MDALKKVVGGNHGSSSAGAAPAGGAQKDDFGDKGAAYVNKNYLGGKLSHDQMEKGTDGIRGQFEKATGKHVPSKISN
ncbi:hypothetical protein F4808DRAFT_459126 [Astrocystis sublimbata]|nr:hypothetical protein F4808DRAFT_459126 [Astrocystis sublimbata]